MHTCNVGNHVLSIHGTFPRRAQLKQEFYFEIERPSAFIEEIKQRSVPADIFTFLDNFPQGPELQPYYHEWDNFAAIEIDTVDNWLAGLPRGTRRALKRAREANIDIDWFQLDDEFVRRIMGIFNESPFRQGRPFWHYGKSFDAVKEMLSRDFERSRFLGAFWQNELIGFVKLILGRNFGRTSLIVSKFAHRDKGTNNALVARAVRACVELQLPFLVYGQLDYGKVGNKTLAEFKVNNGFKRMELARYYVPLTKAGDLALSLGLHKGPAGVLPTPIVRGALSVRNAWYTRKLNSLNLRAKL